MQGMSTSLHKQSIIAPCNAQHLELGGAFSQGSAKHYPLRLCTLGSLHQTRPSVMPCIMEIPQPHFFISNIKYKGYKVQNSNIQCKKNQDELRSTVEMDITV